MPWLLGPNRAEVLFTSVWDPTLVRDLDLRALECFHKVQGSFDRSKLFGPPLRMLAHLATVRGQNTNPEMNACVHTENSHRSHCLDFPNRLCR